MDRHFVVTLARFHRRDTGIYVVQGYFEGNSIAGYRLRAFADSQELQVEIGVREGLAIRQKYITRGMESENIDREYDLWIHLPQEGKAFRTLRVYQYQDEKRSCVFRSSRRRLQKDLRMPDGYLETWHETDGKIAVGGWAVGNSPCRIQVLTSSREKVPCSLTWHYRQDINGNYKELSELPPEELRFGFEAVFPRPAGRTAYMIIASDGQKMEYRLDLNNGDKNVLGGRRSMFTKAIAYLKRNGLRRTIRRCREKLSEKVFGHTESYMQWRRRFEPSKEELAAQAKNEFLNQPLISIVVPLYKTPEKYLRELVLSIQKQTYSNWEICFSDGSGKDSPLKGILEELSGKDKRIRYVSSDRELGIADNTNAALWIVSGDYIAFADHDDLLPEYALYEIVRTINESPEADFIYTDEDKVSMDGKEFFQPHFKTDFNIDLLRSMNYICHLVVVSRNLYERIGALDPEYDGAQDYDFVLRAVEKAEKVCHIPKVLYHWRSHKDSTAENPESKRYAFEAGARAVAAHYKRVGINADVLMGEYPGLYKTVYRVPEEKPLISIIIPNKDHIADLDKCVRSIMQKSTYPAYEFIIVENNSVEEGTFEYYRSMEQQYENFHTEYWDREFNYSLLNNFGAERSHGEYLLFLNNDTEMIAPDCLWQMLGPCMREDVGIVGARLFYPDDTVQHAGVIIGYGGIAGHAFQGFDRTQNGYFSRIICMSDLSAVTAACMMVRRDVFEAVGGFDSALRVAFNDIDFCLRVRDLGKLVVYNPDATMYHYESKSRGQEDTPEKIARFNAEADELLRRHPRIFAEGDPYYNPNLSLNRNDFGLRE